MATRRVPKTGETATAVPRRNNGAPPIPRRPIVKKTQRTNHQNHHSSHQNHHPKRRPRAARPKAAVRTTRVPAKCHPNQNITLPNPTETPSKNASPLLMLQCLLIRQRPKRRITTTLHPREHPTLTRGQWPCHPTPAAWAAAARRRCNVKRVARTRTL